MKRARFRMNDSQAQGDTMNDEGAELIEDAPPAQQFGDEPAGAVAQEPDLVEDHISELQRDLTLERDKLLRLAAEFDNYRKRMMRERLEAESRGKADLVKELLEPMDDIARFAHVDPAVTDPATIVEGVAMVE